MKSFSKRYDLTVLKVTPINSQSDQRTLLLPTCDASGPRVDVKQAEGLVGHDFKDVGVARDKEIRWAGIDHVANRCVVATRITADVLHQDVNILTSEAQYFTVTGMHQCCHRLREM